MKKNDESPEVKTGTDLADSAKDRKNMEPENANLDLPEVKDIPGQEHINPAPAGEMADVTISSSDEEGDSIFNDNTDVPDDDADSTVTQEERDDLRQSANDMPTEDDTNLRRSALDNTDEDGNPLNEDSFKDNVTGTGLDVPGAEADDADEEIGDEDEENNEYSLGGDNHD